MSEFPEGADDAAAPDAGASCSCSWARTPRSPARPGAAEEVPSSSCRTCASRRRSRRECRACYATTMIARRIRHRARRREPRRAADQGRGQPAASGEPRGARDVRAGQRPVDVRPGARPRDHARGRPLDVARAPRRGRRAASAGQARFTCSSSPRAALTWGRSSSACVARAWSCTTTRRSREPRPAPGPSSRSGGSWRRAGTSRAQTSCSHSTATSSPPRGRPWRGRAAWADRRRMSASQRRDEPALCRRAAPDGDRNERGRAAAACRRAKCETSRRRVARGAGRTGRTDGARRPPSAPPRRARRDRTMPGRRRSQRDLHEHAGASLVLAGDGQPPEVHALAHAANELLGNAGRTVTYAPSPVIEAGQVSHGLPGAAAGDRRRRGGGARDRRGQPRVHGLRRPGDRAPHRVRCPRTAYVGLYDNETARLCRWFVPEAHFLEAWSDARAFDGTASIAQPLMRPLAEGKTVGAGARGARRARPARRRGSWSKSTGDRWPAATRARSGSRPSCAASSRAAREAATPDDDRLERAIGRALATPPPPRAPLEIVFFADAKVHDGRFGNSAWLQELGDPVTKLAWDNAALVSPATAARLEISSEDVVEIEVRGRTVRAPVLVHAGHGRRRGRARRSATGRRSPIGSRPASAPTRTRSATRALRGSTTRSAHEDRRVVAARAARRSTGRWRGDRSSCPGRSAEYRADPGVRGAAQRDAALPLRHRARRAPPVGHDDRPQRVHGLQRVRHRVHGREQHPRRRKGRRASEPGDAVDPHRSLSLDRRVRARRAGAADAVPALREGALRVRLPGQRDGPQPRWLERDGLQPVRRHAVLQQQLPVQGPALQLLQLHRRPARRAVAWR